MTEKPTKKPMFLSKTFIRDNEESFQLIPMNNEVPFIGAMFDPKTKALTILHKTTYDEIRRKERYTASGMPVLTNGPKGQKVQAIEVITMLQPHASYLIIEADIIDFVKQMASNPKAFPFEAFIKDAFKQGDIFIDQK